MYCTWKIKIFPTFLSALTPTWKSCWLPLVELLYGLCTMSTKFWYSKMFHYFFPQCKVVNLKIKIKIQIVNPTIQCQYISQVTWIKRLIRDHWCLQISIFMWRHDVTMSRRHYDNNCKSMRFTLHKLLISTNRPCRSHGCPADTNKVPYRVILLSLLLILFYKVTAVRRGFFILLSCPWMLTK